MKLLMFLIELPIRFILALIGFTFGGWIGWAGVKFTFDFMKEFSMFATLAAASGGSAPYR